jgi:hypothetical protein
VRPLSTLQSGLGDAANPDELSRRKAIKSDALLTQKFSIISSVIGALSDEDQKTICSIFEASKAATRNGPGIISSISRGSGSGSGSGDDNDESHAHELIIDLWVHDAALLQYILARFSCSSKVRNTFKKLCDELSTWRRALVEEAHYVHFNFLWNPVHTVWIKDKERNDLRRFVGKEATDLPRVVLPPIWPAYPGLSCKQPERYKNLYAKLRKRCQEARDGEIAEEEKQALATAAGGPYDWRWWILPGEEQDVDYLCQVLEAERAIDSVLCSVVWDLKAALWQAMRGTELEGTPDKAPVQWRIDSSIQFCRRKDNHSGRSEDLAILGWTGFPGLMELFKRAQKWELPPEDRQRIAVAAGGASDWEWWEAKSRCCDRSNLVRWVLPYISCGLGSESKEVPYLCLALAMQRKFNENSTLYPHWPTSLDYNICSYQPIESARDYTKYNREEREALARAAGGPAPPEWKWWENARIQRGLIPSLSNDEVKY